MDRNRCEGLSSQRLGSVQKMRDDSDRSAPAGNTLDHRFLRNCSPFVARALCSEVPEAARLRKIALRALSLPVWPWSLVATGPFEYRWRADHLYG